MQSQNKVVSSDEELLICVNAADEPIGSAQKGACHTGQGLLHRAFSVFLFNTSGQVLLQQRAPGKTLWPGYWANSCCSHPRWEESIDEAVVRRIDEELGLAAIPSTLEFLYKFEYHAQFEDVGSEHELCWVYRGQCEGDPPVNHNEISAWRWIQPTELDAEIAASPTLFTPWLKLEWKRLRRDFF